MNQKDINARNTYDRECSDTYQDSQRNKERCREEVCYESNYLGTVSISAFGNTNRIPPAIQQALNSTGIALNHVPAGDLS
ncbi:hypothetical protein Bca4012_065862 [Brassica carinata]|uniref:Uncharacterized protein n=1 Tax=Brassica carinata TaxID=52824 RepID=A0A8X7VP93_BRACI|nr:hypothetical protein Bca52824_018183 [Brassica carinata]